MGTTLISILTHLSTTETCSMTNIVVMGVHTLLTMHIRDRMIGIIVIGRNRVRGGD